MIAVDPNCAAVSCAAPSVSYEAACLAAGRKMVAVSCCGKACDGSFDPLGAPEAAQGCDDIAYLIAAAKLEVEFPTGGGTCASDADCVASAPILSCTADTCIAGCGEAISTGFDAKRKAIFETAFFREAQRRLAEGKDCPRAGPRCAAREVYCAIPAGVCAFH